MIKIAVASADRIPDAGIHRYSVLGEKYPEQKPPDEKPLKKLK